MLIKLKKIVKDTKIDMDTVKTLKNIEENIEVLDGYLKNQIDPYYSETLKLIQRGTCFIAVKNNNNIKFYPSRFIGYVNNDMDKHLNNTEKDGRVTNSAIIKILKQKPYSDPQLEEAYIKYCMNLNIIPRKTGSFGVARKYWKITV